jgi:hypothetical protein
MRLASAARRLLTAGLLVGLAALPQNGGAQATDKTFAVTSFGARCDGTADDTSAFRAAIAAAAAAGKGTILAPKGRCIISGPLAWESNVSLAGAGMHATTLAASAAYDYDRRLPRSGADGRYAGMIWLDGPTKTDPIVNVTIHDIGFDPRASFALDPQNPKRFFMAPITSAIRPIRHLHLENVFFDLGYNSRSYLGISLGPKAFFGMNIHLNTVCDVPSYDLTFKNIEAHNGIGTLQFIGADPVIPASRCTDLQHAWGIHVDGERDVVDGQYIDDDRIVVDGCQVIPCEIHDISFEHIDTYVADGVTGGVNSVKTSPGKLGLIHGITVSDLTYRGSTTGPYGDPMPSYRWNGSGATVAILTYSINGGYSYDYTIRNVTATDSLGMGLTLSHPPGQAVTASVENVKLTNTHSSNVLGFSALTPPTGHDTVTVQNVTLHAASDAYSFVATFKGSGGGQAASAVLSYGGQTVRVGPLNIENGESAAAVASGLASLIRASAAVAGPQAFIGEVQATGPVITLNAASKLLRPWQIAMQTTLAGNGVSVSPAALTPFRSPNGIAFLPGGDPANGASGTLAVKGATVQNIATPVLVYSDSTFPNVTLDHITWDTGTIRVPRTARVTNSALRELP